MEELKPEDKELVGMYLDLGSKIVTARYGTGSTGSSQSGSRKSRSIRTVSTRCTAIPPTAASGSGTRRGREASHACGC